MSIDKQAKQAMIDIRNEVIRQGRWPTCTNCTYWTEVHEVTDELRVYFKCGKYNMFPPEDVIVVGCINHEAEVPF